MTAAACDGDPEPGLRVQGGHRAAVGAVFPSPEAVRGAGGADAGDAVLRAGAGAVAAVQAAAAVLHRRLTAGGASAGAGAAARGEGWVAGRRPILQAVAPRGMRFYRRQRGLLRAGKAWGIGVLLPGQLMQQAAEQGGRLGGTADLPAEDVGELIGHGGATEGGDGRVMEQHRLGGERGLDRLLRVERAEQVHRGDLAAEFFVRGVGAGGREGVDEGVQGVVGEDRVEGVFVRRAGDCRVRWGIGVRGDEGAEAAGHVVLGDFEVVWIWRLGLCGGWGGHARGSGG